MSQFDIPKSWNVISFGDLNQHKSSIVQPDKYSDTVFELYSVPVFFEGKPEVLIGKEIGSSKQYVESNDVLVCKINPRINRVWIVDEKSEYDQIASSEWIVMRSDIVNSRYLLRYFQSEQFRTPLCADVTGVGGSLTRAQPKKVATFPIPLAPLAEQQVIADKLDTLLAQVESIKARLERIPEILKQFRQSVLAAAVSGKLTEEWRANKQSKFEIDSLTNEKLSLIKAKLVKKDLHVEVGEEIFDLPEGWETLALQSFATKITDGEHSTPKRESSGHYLLSARNVRDGFLDLSNVDYVGNEEFLKLRKRCDPDEGDILISCSGSVGRISLVDRSHEYVMVRSAALVKIMHQFLNNKYLMYILQSPLSQKQIEEKSKSTAQANLFLSQIKELSIPCPSIEEQMEIVRLIDQRFTVTNSIEQQVQSALDRVSNLTQSILAKAFRGELTAEWREANPELISGENSAEALLDRIKTERELAKLATKRGRGKA